MWYSSPKAAEPSYALRVQQDIALYSGQTKKVNWFALLKSFFLFVLAAWVRAPHFGIDFRKLIGVGGVTGFNVGYAIVAVRAFVTSCSYIQTDG